jgi:hypothetical protein
MATGEEASMGMMQVTYVGVSDFRIIEAAQLQHDWGITPKLTTKVPPGVTARIRGLVGMQCDPNVDMVWGPHNGYKLTVDVDEDMERVLREQGHFVLSSIGDDGSTTVVAEATTHEDNPAIVMSQDEQGIQKSGGKS